MNSMSELQKCWFLTSFTNCILATKQNLRIWYYLKLFLKYLGCKQLQYIFLSNKNHETKRWSVDGENDWISPSKHLPLRYYKLLPFSPQKIWKWWNYWKKRNQNFQETLKRLLRKRTKICRFLYTRLFNESI